MELEGLSLTKVKLKKLITFCHIFLIIATRDVLPLHQRKCPTHQVLLINIF